VHESAHYVFRFDSRPAMLSNRTVQHVNRESAIHVQRCLTEYWSRVVEKSGDKQHHGTAHSSDT